MQELTGEGGEPSPSLPTIEDDAALAQLMKVHHYPLSEYHFFMISFCTQSLGHGEHQVREGEACPKVPRLGDATQSHEGGKVQFVRYIL